MEKEIKELFFKLLEKTPTNIENRKLEYILYDKLISITWFTKREDDKEYIPCSIYTIDPFKRSQCKNKHFGYFDWDIRTSPELDGYTFYINTPCGQYTVPELTRQELACAQDHIALKYKEFPVKYLHDLLISVR